MVVVRELAAFAIGHGELIRIRQKLDHVRAGDGRVGAGVPCRSLRSRQQRRGLWASNQA